MSERQLDLFAVATRHEIRRPQASDYGMVEVTERSFFLIMGKLDVHPHPESSGNKEYGMMSRWKRQHTHEVIGISMGYAWNGTETYMVTQSYYSANKAALAKAEGKG